MAEKYAYSINELTKLAGVGRSFLYDEIKHGRLSLRKAGRRSLVMREDFEAWLEKLPVVYRRKVSVSNQRR